MKEFNFPRYFIWGGGASSLLQKLKWADNKLKRSLVLSRFPWNSFTFVSKRNLKLLKRPKPFPKTSWLFFSLSQRSSDWKKSSEVPFLGKNTDNIRALRLHPVSGDTMSQGGGRWQVGVVVHRCEEPPMPTSRRPELSWAAPSEDQLSEMERHQVWRLVSLVALCVGTHR